MNAVPQETCFWVKASVKPEPDTRLGDREQSARRRAESRVEAGALVRCLYIEEAPSIGLDVSFDFGKSTLKPAGAAQLDRLGEALARPSLEKERFVLDGHSDVKESADSNDSLSCDRALSVRVYLKDKHRIVPQKLIPMGFGFSKLKDEAEPNSDVNRRVEIRRYLAEK
jgi:outer membrane protein OmpA-like peptidoglycan-associated protein